MKRIALNALAVLAVLAGGRIAVAQPTWAATLEAESDPSLPIGRVILLTVDSKLKVYVNDGYLDGIAVLGPNLAFGRRKSDARAKGRASSIGRHPFRSSRVTVSMSSTAGWPASPFSSRRS